MSHCSGMTFDGPAITIAVAPGGEPDVPAGGRIARRVVEQVRDHLREAREVALDHQALGLESGVVVCNPVPEADALDEGVAREAIERALREADEAGITGGSVTPWLLARVAAITNGASVKANVALIVDNARVGGLLAAALLP